MGNVKKFEDFHNILGHDIEPSQKKIYPFYADGKPVMAKGNEKDVYVEPGTRLVFDNLLQAGTWKKHVNPIMIKKALEKPNGIAGGFYWSYDPDFVVPY